MDQPVDATTTPITAGSRYRNTRAYRDRTLNKTYFGSWKIPKIRELRQPTYYIVAQDEVHRPDLISYRVYGRVDLWWVIAIRNGLLLPVTDLVSGQSLTCPHLDDIMSALGVSNVNSAGTT